MKWWQKKAVFECYPKSFLDTKGTGTGDLNGVRQKLGYLEELGVSALWLTPVFTSPMVDNGYDVADYYNIDPSYGTMEDMEKLISEAKEHGIRIVMDFVFNHTSDQNKWFIESKKDRTNPTASSVPWAVHRQTGAVSLVAAHGHGVKKEGSTTYIPLRQPSRISTGQILKCAKKPQRFATSGVTRA